MPPWRRTVSLGRYQRRFADSARALVGGANFSSYTLTWSFRRSGCWS